MKPEDKRYILDNIGKKSLKEIADALGIKERKVRKFTEREKDKIKEVAAQTKSHKPVRKKAIIVAVVLLALLGILAYMNSLNGEFVWDDYYLIQDNTFIKNTAYIPEIFKKDIAAGSGKESNSYRPLQILSYIPDYMIWDMDVRGYHLSNILLHILAGLSLFWLITILFRDWLLSFIASALFLIHPIHNEAVAYISGRADSLAAVFIFLSFIFYLKFADTKKNISYVIMVLSFMAALLSRENALILPALLIFYHYSFRNKINIRGFVSVCMIALAYTIIRGTFLRLTTLNLPSGSTLGQRLPGIFVAVTQYMRLLLLPFNLRMEYGALLFKMTNPSAIIGIFILAFLSAYSFIMRRRSNLVFFSVYWFFITLLPSSNLYPINAYMAEHWLYIPSVGFFLIIAGGISYLYRERKAKAPAVIITAVLLLFYSCLTINQNKTWRTAEGFYERILRFDSRNIRALNSLGLIYYNRGQIKEAIPFYKKAIEVSPSYLDAYNNLGIAYRKTGRPKEAIAVYKKAIELDPDFVYTYCNLANAYRDVGNNKEAIELYKKAIELFPNFAYAYNNIGLAYVDEGKPEEALAVYKKAVELKPDYPDTYNNVGNLYNNAGDYKNAIGAYRKAIELKPDYAKAYNNLGVALANSGSEEEAISYYKRAIELDPGYASANFNLSYSYYNNKQLELAVRYYKRAVELGHKGDDSYSQTMQQYIR